ncbi:hypothetical protein MTO96_022200 [Rhipicephalus appendiculatus]
MAALLHSTLPATIDLRSGGVGPARSKEQVATESEVSTSTTEQPDLPTALRSFSTCNNASGPAHSASGLPTPAEARHPQILFTDGTYEPFKQQNATDELHSFDCFRAFLGLAVGLICALVAILFVVAAGPSRSPPQGSGWDSLAAGSPILTRMDKNASRELGNQYGRIKLEPAAKEAEANPADTKSDNGSYSRFQVFEVQSPVFKNGYTKGHAWKRDNGSSDWATLDNT